MVRRNVGTTAQKGHPFGRRPAGGLADVLWDWSKSGTRNAVRNRLLRRLPGVGSAPAYRFGLVERPHYAYGVRRATESAARLGHPGVTVVEFGVAGGNGLLALAEHARYYAAATGVAVRVVGFDGGSGMPPAKDPRDMPYLFGPGFYTMDHDRLRARLGSSELVIGDLARTLPDYLDTHADVLRDHPVGFVSLDLDYYSSTATALDLFRGSAHGHLLPRVTCYLDDLPGTVEQIGEAAAVADFNAERSDRVVGRVLGLRAFTPFDPPWADQIYVHHRLDHPDYARLETGATGDQLPLAPDLRRRGR
ncbi:MULTISPECIES: hypothetical protein [unclassified Streptomyces]|uniref:hypothetical protein n=1 Tax=Streptomycetaceae TaxID=2062 RepID=UPI002E76E418|nr:MULTISPECIES: hypothetical protein [unclassified Streptomyces]MED7952076.1 hypothetical protein [Streptomyces sp. BE303]MEE1822402.1 hypothetical protein [Streptomyces sp. BE20]